MHRSKIQAIAVLRASIRAADFGYPCTHEHWHERGGVTRVSAWAVQKSVHRARKKAERMRRK